MSLILVLSDLFRLKDSHEISMAQEQKNEKAKNAFGIRSDFVPGSSMESNNSNKEKAAAAAVAAAGVVTLEVRALMKYVPTSPIACRLLMKVFILQAAKSIEKAKGEKEKKKKKSHKRKASSSSSASSSSDSSSDEETRRKRKKKEKKKKSKKSHHHHHK